MWKKLLFKTGIAYLVLCLLAYGYYWLGVKWLGFDISSGDKIQTLSMSLWGWTATMITPIAAFLALDGWRAQQRISSENGLATDLLKEYYLLKIEVLKLVNILEEIRDGVIFKELQKEEANKQYIKLERKFREICDFSIVNIQIKQDLLMAITNNNKIKEEISRLLVIFFDTEYGLLALKHVIGITGLKEMQTLSTSWLLISKDDNKILLEILKPYLTYKQ